MKIIKIVTTLEDAINTLLGEMINVETSALYFDNGKLINQPVNGIPVASEEGYPRLVDGNVIEAVKGSRGSILVPIGYDTKCLHELIKYRICIFIAESGIDKIKHLEDYHTIEISNHTNVKLQTEQKNTINGRKSARYGRDERQRMTPNCIRSINDGTSDNLLGIGRFTWNVYPISKFTHKIRSSDIQLAISEHVCSIFFDIANNCTLKHNSILFDFSKRLMIGYELIVDTPRLHFATSGHPLIFELSARWGQELKYVEESPFYIQNPRTNKIFEEKYDNLPIRPGNDLQYDRCTGCDDVLWEENYALAGNASMPDNLCTPICPLCLHSNDSVNYIDQYMRVFRARYPVTMAQKMEMMDIPPGRLDILKEAMICIKTQKIVCNYKTYDCNLIGDKYVSTDDIDTFILSKFYELPTMKGRKICRATLKYFR